MKITIINNERKEKRYTRVELTDFVSQLKDDMSALSSADISHYRYTDIVF